MGRIYTPDESVTQPPPRAIIEWRDGRLIVYPLGASYEQSEAIREHVERALALMDNRE
jgi:hypothetical protein